MHTAGASDKSHRHKRRWLRLTSVRIIRYYTVTPELHSFDLSTSGFLFTSQPCCVWICRTFLQQIEPMKFGR